MPPKNLTPPGAEMMLQLVPSQRSVKRPLELEPYRPDVVSGDRGHRS